MNVNEIELVLNKNNAYPITGRGVFEILKSLGQCEAMFNQYIGDAIRAGWYRIVVIKVN